MQLKEPNNILIKNTHLSISLYSRLIQVLHSQTITVIDHNNGLNVPTQLGEKKEKTDRHRLLNMHKTMI